MGFIGEEIVLREGFLIPTSEAMPDPTLEAYLAPYDAEIIAFNETVIGDTEVPIDALQAYTEETNGANLQADSAVWELMDKASVAVDLHLSGAMTDASVAEGATPAAPGSRAPRRMLNESTMDCLPMVVLMIKSISLLMINCAARSSLLHGSIRMRSGAGSSANPIFAAHQSSRRSLICCSGRQSVTL